MHLDKTAKMSKDVMQPSSSLQSMITSDRNKWDIFTSQLDKVAKNRIHINKSWVMAVMGYADFDILTFRKNIMSKVGLRDLVLLVMIFLMRGNNFKCIKEYTNTSEVVARLKTLDRSLQIQRWAAGRNQVVTLSRIAISFPEVVAPILKTIPKIPGPVTLQQIKNIAGYPEYPAMARHPALACFLPKDHKQSLLVLNVFFLVNMMISETIDQRNKVWKKGQTKVYQLKAFNSCLFSEEMRIEWCQKLGVMINGEFSVIWITAAEKAKAKLENTYQTSF